MSATELLRSLRPAKLSWVDSLEVKIDRFIYKLALYGGDLALLAILGKKNNYPHGEGDRPVRGPFLGSRQWRMQSGQVSVFPQRQNGKRRREAEIFARNICGMTQYLSK